MRSSGASAGRKPVLGFTLIELLVVIAIIGILSSVVLASLNTARTRGNDAKVKSQLKNMGSAMALYRFDAGNYGASSINDGCTTAPNAAPWTDAASGMASLADEDNYPTGSSLTCYTSGDAWAVQAVVTGGYFCVDSTGAAKQGASMLTTAGDVIC